MEHEHSERVCGGEGGGFRGLVAGLVGALEGEAEGHVDGAPRLVFAWGRIFADIDAEGTDDEVVTDAYAEGVPGFIPVNLVGVGEVSSVGKDGPAEFGEQGKIGFCVEGEELVATEGFSGVAVRGELAFGEASNGVGAAEEESFVDGDFG